MTMFNFIVLVFQAFVSVFGMIFAAVNVYRLLVTQGSIFIILCFLLIFVLAVAMLISAVREVMPKRK